jgi:hypothetical protein
VPSPGLRRLGSTSTNGFAALLLPFIRVQAILWAARLNSALSCVSAISRTLLGCRSFTSMFASLNGQHNSDTTDEHRVPRLPPEAGRAASNGVPFGNISPVEYPRRMVGSISRSGVEPRAKRHHTPLQAANLTF